MLLGNDAGMNQALVVAHIEMYPSRPLAIYICYILCLFTVLFPFVFPHILLLQTSAWTNDIIDQAGCLPIIFEYDLDHQLSLSWKASGDETRRDPGDYFDANYNKGLLHNEN